MRLQALDSLRIDRPDASKPERAYFVSYSKCPPGHVRVRNQSRCCYEVVPREWVKKCRWIRKPQQEELFRA